MLARPRHIALLTCNLLLWFSVSLHAKVIYETDFMANPSGATTSTAKGAFTTTMPDWGRGYSSAYLTSGSAGSCAILFTQPLNLSSYKEVVITIDYGSVSNRPLLLSINDGGDNTIFTMTSKADRSVVIHATTTSTVTSLSKLNVHSSGGGNVYFFHLTISDSLIIDCTGKTTTSTTQATITAGSSYTWFGKPYTQQGIYTDTIPNAAGCDSIGTLILAVCDATPDTITTKIIINEGTSYYWKYTDTKYHQSILVHKDTTNDLGCPAVMQLDLTVQRLADADTAHSMCEGDVFEWRGLTITEAGKYTAEDGSNKTIHIGVLPRPEVMASPDQQIQLGQSVQLYALGADYYRWCPTDSLGKACLSSTWDANPVATPLVSTTYHVSSYNSADHNGVINGDFEFGPSGAASGNPNETHLPTGAVASYETDLWYSRNDRKFGTHNISHWSGELFGKSDKFPDHTKGDGTGWYIVVDGFNREKTPNDSIIWQQTVNVTPGLNYIFSAWFVSLSSKSPAKLQFCVNGQPLGKVLQSPSMVNEWARYYELWTNKNNITQATLTITNLNPDGDGNDFGLDDISFQALGPCSGEDSVKITINFDAHFYPNCANTIQTRTLSDLPGVQHYSANFQSEGCSSKTGYYVKGDQITATAHNDGCTVFDQWSDGNTDNPRIFTVDQSNLQIQPIYKTAQYIVHVQSNNGNVGDVDITHP